MNEPIAPRAPLKLCPKCRRYVEDNWSVCPICGLRLKPGNDLLPRALMWLGILLAYIASISGIAAYDPDLAGGLGLLIGLPLTYVFGKAVLFRLQGTPLTWNQLWKTGFRAVMAAILMFVILPLLLGLALLILLFAVCGGMMGGIGH